MRNAQVAREVWGGLAVLAVAGFWAAAQGWYGIAVAAAAAAAALGWLFRDPKIAVSHSPLALAAPGTGVCRGVERAYDPWLERDSMRVDLRVGWRGPYRLFAPTEGKIVDIRHRRASGRRRNVEMRFRTDEGEEVVLAVRQRWPAQLRLDYAPGERVGHARRLGMAVFGGSLSLRLPADVALELSAGAPVEAPLTVVARLNRDVPARNESVDATA